MKSKIFGVTIVVVLCLLTIGAKPHNVESFIIGVNNMDVAMAQLHSQGIHVRLQIPGINAIAVKANYHALQRMPFVQYIEIDPPDVVSIMDDQLEYGVDNIDAEVVWGGGEDATDVISGQGGAGIKVAVVDTGVDCSHEDLAGHCYLGGNFVPGAHVDDFGHGTHVAGIIAARDNGLGYIGVAPEVEIYSVKVLDSNGTGYWSWIAAGIDWATQNGMDIINMSLGGDYYNYTVHRAIQDAVDKGILVVSSAGNDGCCDTVAYPARLPESMSISAVDVNDILAYFSSTGVQVDVSAPGMNILSAVPTYSCQLCDPSGYRALSGTSMAAPHVSGVGALLMAQGWDNLEARDIIKSTALDVGEPGFDSLYGHGRVDALAASVGEPIPVPNPPSSCDCIEYVTKEVVNIAVPFETMVDVSGNCSELAVEVTWKGKRGAFWVQIDGITAYGDDHVARMQIRNPIEGTHTIKVFYVANRDANRRFELRIWTE